MRTPLLFNALLVLFLLSSPTVQAQTAPTRNHDRIDLGKLNCKAGLFPKEEEKTGGEGWVNLRLTVQPDGSLTDLENISNAGRDSFIAGTLRNFAKCRFSQPWQENGQPVALTNIYMRISYAQSPNRAGEGVKEKTQTIQQLLSQGRLDEAATSLDEAEKAVNRLTELNDIILLRSILMSKRGLNDIALLYLQEIPAGEPQSSDDANIAKVLRIRLGLELKLGLLASAEVTGRKLKQAKPQPEDAALWSNLEKLRQLGASGQPLAVAGRVPAECRPMICDPAKPSWEYVPVHRTVSLADAKGRLDQVILRCTRKTVTIPAATGQTWTIPAKLGQCAVEVTGEPGATFTLIDETL
ncbi:MULTISPECIES: energy transducer TonB [unclassified Azospirillum]|uniref:energy transducer TonB n=1 Tax=unclassified Azospirillum TaxID=2630922 RepID=UPI000B74435D|nr:MULTISPECIES: energy transducer TonB [unclassified Azospirillum]SNS54870.1 TonB protein C-terminal [Azospirillum sp. RU38E]SNS74429.1 TonB protein C-terminal [Azospirillum sp. RU37A]